MRASIRPRQNGESLEFAADAGSCQGPIVAKDKHRWSCECFENRSNKTASAESAARLRDTSACLIRLATGSLVLQARSVAIDLISGLH